MNCLDQQRQQLQQLPQHLSKPQQHKQARQQHAQGSGFQRMAVKTGFRGQSEP